MTSRTLPPVGAGLCVGGDCVMGVSCVAQAMHRYSSDLCKWSPLPQVGSELTSATGVRNRNALKHI
jgi:hypothetical protein